MTYRPLVTRFSEAMRSNAWCHLPPPPPQPPKTLLFFLTHLLRPRCVQHARTRPLTFRRIHRPWRRCLCRRQGAAVHAAAEARPGRRSLPELVLPQAELCRLLRTACFVQAMLPCGRRRRHVGGAGLADNRRNKAGRCRPHHCCSHQHRSGQVVSLLQEEARYAAPHDALFETVFGGRRALPVQRDH